MRITIYILCFNEELILPHIIDFYRKRFPLAIIVIYDNASTDRSREIALAKGCHVEVFNTNNQISDLRYQYIKNECWKNSGTDWNLVCDADEFLEITQDQLMFEDAAGTTIIRGTGYNMVNMYDNDDIASIDHGYRDNDVAQFYDKPLLFNKKYITEMNYIIGAHASKPEGRSDYNKANKYRLLHYHYISPDIMVEKFKVYGSRLSKQNIENGWGARYLETEGTIRLLFEEYRKKAIKIL